MSSKVKCTCGWSWNKSDSSKKDMYICHECGRDNSNNMKNGGWLDNYGEEANANEGHSSASKEWVGEGYSNVGRNYSPAWGGSFQDGGLIPIAQDGIQKMSSRKKRNIDLSIKDIKNEKKDLYELQTTGQVKNPRSLINQKQKRELDKKKTYIDQDRRTDYERQYDEDKGKAKETKRKIISTADEATDLMQLGNFIPNPYAQIVGEIGNIAGAGIDAYQAAEDFSEGNYESGVINAASATLPALLSKGSFARNSKYLQPGEVMYPLSPQAFGNPARTKYLELFNTTRGATPFNTNINRSLLGALGAEAAYDLPEYQMGGSVYPVNYVPQAQMGGTIAGAPGFSYARTQGAAPSNGKYAKKTMASAQNGKEMQYYQNGLDWQPKSISRDGSVIKDDRGQWDHPGEITEIGSNDITMEGVPYDVLGISDTGDTKLMKPGKNYKFKGKKVTEYPMAKDGLRQEQKGLQNLDNLTNFTNYNKPQPGGWLNKYN